MDFKTKAAAVADAGSLAGDALLLVLAGPSVPDALDGTLGEAVRHAVKTGDLALKAGQSLYLHRVDGVKASRVAVAVAADASSKAICRAAVAAMNLVKSGGARQALLAVVGDTAVGTDLAEALVLALSDAAYVYRETKPSAPAPSKLQAVTLLCTREAAADVERGLQRGAAVAAGVELARELGNLPGNHGTPSKLAATARGLARSHGLKVEVLERKDLEKLGMGAFLGVAQGSEQPPKFIVARWQGAGRRDAPVVLVGKGITFDSGGISLKPAPEMDEMKFDMGGAASVLGTLRALAELKARINVVGLIPACENLPGGRALKPGDVLHSLSGQTIEVLNTDAEGRLILCDALTYAERFKPSAVIDVATLTGACVIALGHHRTGLFSSSDELAADLLAAGEAALDPAWRMPLDEEYDEALKSNFADVPNVGPRAGGSITAAKFLQRFAKAYPWAHLDIAGTAWKSGAAKGATGRPVPLLTRFLLKRAA